MRPAMDLLASQVLANRVPEGERRSSLRRSLYLEVSLTSESCFFVGLTGDLSTGGVFIATYQPHVVGSRIAVEITLPSGVVCAHGTVRWVRVACDTAGPGVGISFDGMPLEDRARVERFCAERAPLYYELGEAS